MLREPPNCFLLLYLNKEIYILQLGISCDLSDDGLGQKIKKYVKQDNQFFKKSKISKNVYSEKCLFFQLSVSCLSFLFFFLFFSKILNNCSEKKSIWWVKKHTFYLNKIIWWSCAIARPFEKATQSLICALRPFCMCYLFISINVLK